MAQTSGPVTMLERCSRLPLLQDDTERYKGMKGRRAGHAAPCVQGSRSWADANESRRPSGRTDESFSWAAGANG